MFVSRLIRTGKNVLVRYTHTQFFPAVDPIQEKKMDERCILVNEKDEATGYASKRECHRVHDNGILLLHRAFSVFLFNKKNELVLQKRSSTKITFPGYVSNTCCSHPLYDIAKEREEKDALGVKLAAQRTLNFELGIPVEEIDLESLHFLTRIHYRSPGDGIWGEHEIDYILVLHKDVKINPNPFEISDILYIPENKLDDYLNNLKAPITPWFNFLVKTNRLKHWWDNLHQLDKVTEKDKIHTI